MSFHIFPKSFINQNPHFHSLHHLSRRRPPLKLPSLSSYRPKSNQYLSMIIEITYKFKSSIVFQWHKFDTNIIIHSKLGCYFIANNFPRYVYLFINLHLIYILISSYWFPTILFALFKWLIQTLCSCWIGKLYPYKIYTLNAQI